jgi:hypothetical protein
MKENFAIFRVQNSSEECEEGNGKIKQEVGKMD